MDEIRGELWPHKYKSSSAQAQFAQNISVKEREYLRVRSLDGARAFLSVSPV